jgi:hypothetical protein
VPTADGTLYFKEADPALAHEARLIDILAAHRPELVTEVAFSDEDGRMLMRDAGPQVSSRAPDPRDWEELLPLYAELQIEAAGDAGALLQAGAFDRRSTVLPAQYRELIAERAPGQTEAEYEQLLALETEVDRVCAELAAGPVPDTINNDDFTDGSVHVTGAGYRFLDWGDACVSHPFMTLTVTQRVIEIRHGLAPRSAEVANSRRLSRAVHALRVARRDRSDRRSGAPDRSDLPGRLARRAHGLGGRSGGTGLVVPPSARSGSVASLDQRARRRAAASLGSSELT